MSEGVYGVVQLGRQASIATAVAATTVFPVDQGFLGFDLARGTESPDEDFGSVAREQAGRESHGVRWATASLPFVVRYQDLMHALEMHVAAVGTPTGSPTRTWTYTFADSASTLDVALKPYTVEYGVAGAAGDMWRAYGVVADTLELGFDALSAPGNAMWKGTLGLVGIAREANTLTAGQTAPATLETAEGHLTVFSEGDTATAFASLGTATATLKQFSMRSGLGAVGRAYGGASDTAQAIGRSQKATVEFDALLGISSTTKTDVHDVFNVAGSVATERRWSLKVTGSGVNTLTINSRVRFRAVNVGEHEGERLYAVNGVFVRDSTLGGQGQLILTNSVAAIP